MAREAGTRAVVLSGGGARGAYGAGVLRFVFEDLQRSLGRIAPPEIALGTSVGAIHACYLAATADGEWLYLHLVLPREITLQGGSVTTRLLLDLDADASTGQRVKVAGAADLGMDLDVVFSPADPEKQGRPGAGIACCRRNDGHWTSLTRAGSADQGPSSLRSDLPNNDQL